MVALHGETMGTQWSLRYVATAATGPAMVRAAVQARLDQLVAEMSHWNAQSDLCRFNAAAANEWCALPTDLLTVLQAALALAEHTQGAYDPTAGPLVDLWGFGPQGAVTTPPSAHALAQTRASVGWQRVRIHPARHSAWQAGGVQLDLSSIAKGFAVDALSTLLSGLGLAHHLVEVGGELRGMGLKPDGQPWWVQLEVPQASGLPLPDMVVALHGLAVATSGDYRQGFTHQGQHYSHTIDPRTGWPVQHGVTAVTVLHAQAMQADALATALLVMGLQQGLAYAAQHHIAARFVLRKRTGLLQQCSPALQALMTEDSTPASGR